MLVRSFLLLISEGLAARALHDRKQATARVVGHVRRQRSWKLHTPRAPDSVDHSAKRSPARSGDGVRQRAAIEHVEWGLAGHRHPIRARGERNAERGALASGGHDGDGLAGSIALDRRGVAVVIDDRREQTADVVEVQQLSTRVRAECPQVSPIRREDVYEGQFLLALSLG